MRYFWEGLVKIETSEETTTGTIDIPITHSGELKTLIINITHVGADRLNYLYIDKIIGDDRVSNIPEAKRTLMIEHIDNTLQPNDIGNFSYIISFDKSIIVSQGDIIRITFETVGIIEEILGAVELYTA